MQAVVIYSDEMKFKVLQTCGPCISPDNEWLVCSNIYIASYTAKGYVDKLASSTISAEYFLHVTCHINRLSAEALLTPTQCLGGQCKTLYWWSCSVCSRQRWQNIPPIFRDQSSRLQLPKSCIIRLDGCYLFCWLSSDINILIWPDATDAAPCHEMLWEWPHWWCITVYKMAFFTD